MAFGGGTACQKGALWWAAHHRVTTSSPTPSATPTRRSKGFWWSHVGWILCDKYSATDTDAIKDFARYPELRWLDKHHWMPMWTLGLACFLIGGWSGLVVGFFVVDVLLWHADVHDQLAGSPVRPAALRHARHSRNNWVLARCSRWARAGTTTTTTTRVGQPGLLLVGDRRQGKEGGGGGGGGGGGDDVTRDGRGVHRLELRSRSRRRRHPERGVRRRRRA